MNHIVRFNESGSSVMDNIVPFIMDYSPYINTSSQFEELFNLNTSLTAKYDDP